MPAKDSLDSGLDDVGPLRCGTHFCCFWSHRQELVDTLVPYFATGLAADEFCIWVTSDALPRDEAEELLAAAVPDYGARRARGQIEIHDHRDWYLRAGASAADVLRLWLRKEAEARERGFRSLRLSGDTSFVGRSGWDAFVEYEREVDAAFHDRRLLGLCTYDASRCGPGEVHDVLQHHAFALTRRDGRWALLRGEGLQPGARDRDQTFELAVEQRVAARTRELEDAVRSRDVFLAMLGHELRNPLAPIRSGAQIVSLLAGDNEELQRIGRMLDRQAGHMGRLLDDLLDVARSTRGQVALDLRPVDVAQLLAETIEAHQAAITARRQHLVVRDQPCAAAVSGDATRLGQVFGNLLDNAIKYTPEGGRITVQTQRDGGDIVVSVADTGIGIAAGALARVFEPFAQELHQDCGKAGGLGLGLAVVRHLVELHGGSVQAASPGRHQGSTFTVRLPVLTTAN